MSRRGYSEGGLFIGRLSKSCRVRDLEDVFEPYGRMSRCEIKYGAEMAYAFVDYEDKRDAEDAIRYENGREVAGSSIIVEWSKGAPRRSRDSRDVRDSRDSRDSGGSGRSRGADECYRCRRSGHWARDCPDDRHYGFRRPSNSNRRSRSPRRRRSRSPARSYDRRRRDSRRSRSRSRSAEKKSRSRSRSAEGQDFNGGANRAASRSRSPSADRERSPTPN